MEQCCARPYLPHQGQPSSGTVLLTYIGDCRSVAVIAAHPDDEIIGVGGHLALWKGVRILYVTDGAPRDMRDAVAAGCAEREAYAEMRHQEARAALAEAGISDEQVHELGFVDQDASLHLFELSLAVARFLKKFSLAAVITHPYEGGHPDHDATAFAVHSAAALLDLECGKAPLAIEMASYHSRDGRMETGELLPVGQSVGEVVVTLSKEQQSLKRRMLACHRSQTAVLRSFDVEVERLRIAPCYDFTQPPHSGMLFYEQFDWGMSGERWRKLASEALAELAKQKRLVT